MRDENWRIFKEEFNKMKNRFVIPIQPIILFTLLFINVAVFILLVSKIETTYTKWIVIVLSITTIAIIWRSFNTLNKENQAFIFRVEQLIKEIDEE